MMIDDDKVTILPKLLLWANKPDSRLWIIGVSIYNLRLHIAKRVPSLRDEMKKIKELDFVKWTADDFENILRERVPAVVRKDEAVKYLAV